MHVTWQQHCQWLRREHTHLIVQLEPGQLVDGVVAATTRLEASRQALRTETQWCATHATAACTTTRPTGPRLAACIPLQFERDAVLAPTFYKPPNLQQWFMGGETELQTSYARTHRTMTAVPFHISNFPYAGSRPTGWGRFEDRPPSPGTCARTRQHTAFGVSVSAAQQLLAENAHECRLTALTSHRAGASSGRRQWRDSASSSS